MTIRRCAMAAVVHLTVAAATGAATSDALDVRLGRFLDRAEALGFGGQVLVARDGRVVFHEAYGTRDWRTGEPFTRETPTGIASVSKMLTAASTLSLVDDGRLGIDDSLGALLPEVSPVNAGITVRQLLTHTSGLPGGYLEAAPDTSIAEAAARALAAARDTSLTGTWRYSSEGFLLLAAIGERAAARPWDALVRERVLEPAGMTRTTTRRRRPPESARGYVALRDATRDDAAWSNAGAGDLFSTAEDLWRWSERLRRRELLSAGAWSLVTTPAAPIAGGHAAGAGTFLRESGEGPAAIEHGGDDLGGYGAFLGIFEDPDVTIAITSNARDHLGRWWRRALGDAVESIVFRDADPAGPPLTTVSAADRRALAGTYRIGDGALHLVDSGGPFVLVADGQEALDALSGTPPDPSLAAADERITKVLDALLAGRPADGFGHLVDAATVPILIGWWSGYQERWGPLERTRITGSVRDAESVATFVVLQLARGVRTVRFVTNDSGELQQLDPERVAELPVVLPVAREADGTLRGEDPFTGRTVRFRVRDDRLEVIDGPVVPRVPGLPRFTPEE